MEFSYDPVDGWKGGFQYADTYKILGKSGSQSRDLFECPLDTLHVESECNSQIDDSCSPLVVAEGTTGPFILAKMNHPLLREKMKVSHHSESPVYTNDWHGNALQRSSIIPVCLSLS